MRGGEQIHLRLICVVGPILTEFAQGMHDAIEFGLRDRDWSPPVAARESSLDAALIGIQLHCNPARVSFRIAQLEPAITLILDIEDPRQDRGLQHEQHLFAMVHTRGQPPSGASCPE